MVFAGTFDHLHEGHKHILRIAFRLGETVGIGLTSDAMIEHKTDRKLIQDYDERLKNLTAFIESECDLTRCDIFSIETREGGADKMKDLDALIVSDEIGVVQSAFDINKMRMENGLTRFHIIVIPRVCTSDGRPLSSSRIRRGEVFHEDDLVY
ncbi:MAG: phosphopantetheine adenylyltransferase [Candidatus Thorarchaeota archaeon]|nr:MAG: phosphopantetheine adenylyltransferase [Candidatus Thorarchaeota archaeon]